MIDPFWGLVKLAMHMDGPDGSTNFVDEKGGIVTAHGNAVISTAQSKFGGAAAYFDGEGDYLTVDTPLGQLLDQASACCVECWVWLNPTKVTPAGNAGYYGSPILGQSINGGQGEQLFGLTSGNLLRLWRFNAFGSDAIDLQSTNPVTDATWTHVAASFDGTDIRLFIDGNLEAQQAAQKFWVNPGTAFYLFREIVSPYPQYQRYFNGYIDDLRITVGVARYTANFTPPNAPFPDTGPPDNSRVLGAGLIASRIQAAFRGNHRVHGSVNLESAPAPGRRVLLYDRRSMRPIAQTFADANGRYEFSGVKPGTYLVVGQDRLTHYHPDIVRVDSEPM